MAVSFDARLRVPGERPSANRERQPGGRRWCLSDAGPGACAPPGSSIVTAGAVVFVHGYGVRGSFWSALRPLAEKRFPTVLAPDLAVLGCWEGVALLSDYVSMVHSAYGVPVVLIGHSFGTTTAALTARNLGATVVSQLVLIAGPYGEPVGRSFSPLYRLLYAMKMLPSRTIRNRLYGPDVPDEVKAEIRRTHVMEAETFRAELRRQRRWYHTGAFSTGLDQPSLVIASARDRMVSLRETTEFARAIRATLHVFPAAERIGHNDFGVHAPAAERTWRVVEPFLTGGEIGRYDDPSVLS